MSKMDKAVRSFEVQRVARLYLAEGFYPVKPAFMREIISTLRHAEVFIRTREKMHPTGQQLYRELLNELEQHWWFPSDENRQTDKKDNS